MIELRLQRGMTAEEIVLPRNTKGAAEMAKIESKARSVTAAPLLFRFYI